ncbi:hypothetical protein CWE09_11935 [Aliidiomarina minuta]|uniref:DUF1570 domain-containing protein n=1 Tax=Aliidiomarina minuta TaxID=880057 RepID=A0A432W3H4_9GAMM|nr:hypothetical protein [Aliidiomarina minuta]RUO23856.1 hypothetical protein CWE09_11935 [Aliidiomarina minuta]
MPVPRLFMLLLCSLAITACSSRPSSEIQLTDAEQSLVNSAAYIAERSPLVADVWPGFWSANEPFLLYRVDELALLITDKEPIAGYEQVDDDLLPSMLRGRSYFYPGSLPRLESGFVLSYPVQNYQVTAVQLQPDSRNNLSTLVHEAFHAYQQQHFTPGSQPHVDDEVFSAYTVRALLRMQQRLLQHMLNLSGQESHDFAHDYLTLRLVGEQIMPPSAIQLQRNSERMEGSAQLMGLKAVFGRAGDSSALTEHLQQSLEGSPDGIQEQMDLWAAGYHTGASLALILTRFEEDWQTPLAEGRHLQHILADFTDFNAEVALTQANDVLARHDFNHWVAWAERQSMRSAQPSVREFTEQHSTWVELRMQVSMQDEEPESDINFSSGPAGMSRPQENIILLGRAENLTFYSHGVRLVAQQVPALINTQELHRGEILFKVAVTDLPQLCEGLSGCTLENLGLNVEGLIITSENPVDLNYQDSTLSIQIH